MASAKPLSARATSLKYLTYLVYYHKPCAVLVRLLPVLSLLFALLLPQPGAAVSRDYCVEALSDIDYATFIRQSRTFRQLRIEPAPVASVTVRGKRYRIRGLLGKSSSAVYLAESPTK